MKLICVVYCTFTSCSAIQFFVEKLIVWLWNLYYYIQHFKMGVKGEPIYGVSIIFFFHLVVVL